jgi:RNA polymerase sigma-70 factor (ECF subfamily)
MVAFLSGVMRSLRAEHWRRAHVESRHRIARPRTHDTEGPESDASEVPERSDPDPERAVMALQAMESIGRLFAGDPVALQIIMGLAEGLSPEEIRRMSGISRTDYDSARRRMRRALLREGLTSCQEE